MKIRIVKKGDKKTDFKNQDIGVIDLNKVIGIRQKQPVKDGDSVFLQIFTPGVSVAMCFPSSKFIFEEVEISCSGKVAYIKRDISEIIHLYELFG